MYYQRKVDELEATVRLYEQRITIADEQIRNDLDSLKYLGERAKTVGDTIDELIELFAEYQRGVEQLLRDYNTLRNELKSLIKVLIILLSIMAIRSLAMVVGYILYAKGIKVPRWLDILL